MNHFCTLLAKLGGKESRHIIVIYIFFFFSHCGKAQKESEAEHKRIVNPPVANGLKENENVI